MLAQLGIANRLAQITGARHTGIWIKWGGPCRCEPFGADAVGPWQGFQVWRADLDGLLMTRAQELGAEVRRPLAVTGLARCGVMAAATLDPTSSHGVLKAIMSGMMAGHLIAGVLSGRAPGG